MHGFFNKVLEIDVTNAKGRVLDIPDSLFLEVLGGKGLATRLLLEHNPAGVDPLGPDNRLIFATGPTAGTRIWGSCRHGIYTKSPQTGFYSESYAGGTAAEPMAATGFDAVMLKGASDRPVWIEVSPAGVEFHPADGLWGSDSYKAELEVKGWIKKNRSGVKRPGVLVIGPAGENMVSFAVVENDLWRSAGRTGVGAVMGSKKVKAIAFYGDAKKSVADNKKVGDFAKALAKDSKEDAGVKAYKSMGTPMLVDMMNNAGGFPSRYWHKGRSGHAEKINAAALHERCEVKPNACLKCFIACGRMSTVKSGRHQGLKIEGPEYETIYSFGGLCEVADIEEVAYLNDICDRLGMDTISAGNMVAMAIEAADAGKIDLDLEYGDVDGMAALLEDIAYGRGVGEVLAKGVRHAAPELGMEDIAIHVKGMEPAGYDPRVLKGMGLAYASSDRGACHLRATFYKPELAGMMDPEQIKGKAKMFVEWEDRLTIFDTLILCRFYRDLYQWDRLDQIISAVTGRELGVDGMRAVAARVSNDARRFNLREGLTPADDQLPKRFFDEPLPENGHAITREQMDVMLSEYYQARGWSRDGRVI